MSVRLVSRLLMLFMICGSAQLHAVDLADLWQTPEQRAAKQHEAERFDTLVEQAPNERWRGIGHYGAGDYAAAVDAFEASAQSTDPTIDDLYNQATALTRVGDYDRAIDLLDQVLSEQPDADDARQNRDIAESLRELSQQPPQQGGQGDSGEQGEAGESGESQASGETQQGDDSTGESEAGDSQAQDQASDSSSDDQLTSAEQSSSEQSARNDQGGDDGAQEESGDAGAVPPEAQTDEQAMQEAADALASGSDDVDEGDRAPDEDSGDGAMGEPSRDPLSEADQATEQWLRRIPDDPAGLLRRKLEQSHRNDYPEVRDAQRAW